VCSLLLAHGADPTLPNCHNKAAVDVAQRDLQERLHYEFKGHQVLEAARQADSQKLKRSISGDNSSLLSFKHPFTGDTALVCVGAVCLLYDEYSLIYNIITQLLWAHNS